MPTFFFNLIHRGGVTLDPDGTTLPDEPAARLHAEGVARELMQHRESATRFWRLRVCDDERRLLFEVPFVEIDPTLLHLPLHLREAMRDVVVGAASLGNAIHDVRFSIRQLRGTMARADGLPYLVALDGRTLPDRPATQGRDEGSVSYGHGTRG
jgi:hypothetical protein